MSQIYVLRSTAHRSLDQKQPFPIGWFTIRDREQHSGQSRAGAIKLNNNGLYCNATIRDREHSGQSRAGAIKLNNNCL